MKQHTFRNVNNYLGQGKSTAHISANVNRLSSFCRLMALRGSTKIKRKVIDVRRKYEPLIYLDPNYLITNIYSYIETYLVVKVLIYI
jgi:hypothetical protein